MGLFDTVNSVPRFENAWMQRSKFPYTARSSARVIRHAVGIDERRAKFRQDLISGPRPHGKEHKRHRHNLNPRRFEHHLMTRHVDANHHLHVRHQDHHEAPAEPEPARGQTARKAPIPLQLTRPARTSVRPVLPAPQPLLAKSQ